MPSSLSLSLLSNTPLTISYHLVDRRWCLRPYSGSLEADPPFPSLSHKQGAGSIEQVPRTSSGCPDTVSDYSGVEIRRAVATTTRG